MIVRILLAALAAFVVGSIWYAPPVFGRTWGRWVAGWLRASEEELSRNPPPLALARWFLTAVANAAGLAWLLELSNATDLASAATVAAAAWLTCGVGFSAWQVVFARQPARVWLLNNAAFLAMQAAIVGVLVSGR